MMVNGRMWGEADMVSDKYYIIILSIYLKMINYIYI